MVPITQDVGARLYQQWADMWNGDLGLASSIIIQESFAVHLTDIGLLFGDPEQLRRDSPAHVSAWVQRIRGRYAELVYSTKGGPFVDAEQNTITVAWQAEGVFSGKTSQPNDIAGNVFTIVGVDVLKVMDGKFVEYWAINSPGPWHS